MPLPLASSPPFPLSPQPTKIKPKPRIFPSPPGRVPRALGGKTDDSGPGDKAATVRPSRHGFHMLGRAGPRGWGRVNVRSVENDPFLWRS